MDGDVGVRPQAERIVVLVGFDGVQALDLIGPLEVLTKANMRRPAGSPAYRVVLASIAGAEIVSNSGLRLGGLAPIGGTPKNADTVVVAGGSEAALTDAAGNAAFLAWLKRHARTSRRIASVCTGAFLLAAAGLLDGRRATTHWSSLDRLKSFRPEIDIDRDAIFTAHDGVYTSAGVTAGVDLTLAFVEDDLGAPTALAVARDLVLFLRRPGGQAQFSATLAAQAAATPKLRSLLAWMAENFAGDLSVGALAGEAGMSERTFARRFRAETGETPARHVEALRFDRARMYLETTDWPLARVAERSGLGSVPTLLRVFRRRVGVTPEAFRARFGGRN